MTFNTPVCPIFLCISPTFDPKQPTNHKIRYFTTMHISVSTIGLIAAAATVVPSMALPTTVKSEVLEKRITPNTQSCTVTDNVFFLSYSVDIGIDYAGGSGCNNVLGAIQGQGVAVTNWQCVDDGSGGTQLWFNTPNGVNAGDGINTALLVRSAISIWTRILSWTID